LKLKVFWLTYLFASIAFGIYMVAFSWLTVKHYGALGISLITLGFAIPQSLFVLIGGIASDKINKHILFRICQGSYIFLSLILLATCIKEAPPLWFLVAMSFATGVVAAFSGPSKTSLISALVDRSMITSTQQWFNLASGLGIVLGSTISSHLLSTHYLFNNNDDGALSFLAYAIAMTPLLFCIPKPQEAIPLASTSLEKKFHLQTVVLNIKEALTYLNSERSIRMLMSILLMIFLLGTPFSYLLSIFAHDHPRMGNSSQFFSHLYAALGAGNVLGSLLGIYLAKAVNKNATLFIYLILGLSCSAIISMEINTPVGIIFFIILTGICGTLSTNLLKDLIQSLCENMMRGRIAAFTQLLVGLSSMSAGLAGFLIHYLSTNPHDSYGAYEDVQSFMLGLLALLGLSYLPKVLKAKIEF